MELTGAFAPISARDVVLHPDAFRLACKPLADQLAKASKAFRHHREEDTTAVANCSTSENYRRANSDTRRRSAQLTVRKQDTNQSSNKRLAARVCQGRRLDSMDCLAREPDCAQTLSTGQKRLTTCPETSAPDRRNRSAARRHLAICHQRAREIRSARLAGN